MIEADSVCQRIKTFYMKILGLNFPIGTFIAKEHRSRMKPFTQYGACFFLPFLSVRFLFHTLQMGAPCSKQECRNYPGEQLSCRLKNSRRKKGSPKGKGCCIIFLRIQKHAYLAAKDEENTAVHDVKCWPNIDIMPPLTGKAHSLIEREMHGSAV